MKLKKELSLLLSAAIIVAGTNAVYAQDTYTADNIAEDSVTAMASKTAYEVVGGNIYYDANGAIVDADTSIIEAVIPESIDGVAITKIGYEAFWKCSNLYSVTLPDSIQSIDNEAFSACSSLSEITIPDSVMVLGSKAFWGCNTLTSVKLPSNIRAIGDSTFFNCSSLTSIVIPEGVKTIGKSAFSGCSVLSDITLPNSLTSIGGSAFKDCDGISEIVIPNGTTSIGEYAFSYSGLKKITIPKSVTGIGKSAFFKSYFSNDVTIVCTSGSTAESYAIANNIAYELTGGSVYAQLSTADTISINGSNEVVFYPIYKDKEITVDISLTGVEDTPGINSYSFFVTFNPRILQMTGIATPALLDGYMTYTDASGALHTAYDEDMINNAINMIPAADDPEYADVIISGGAFGDAATSGSAYSDYTCGKLGKVKLSGSFSDAMGLATTDKSGKLISLKFKVIGEGDSKVSLDVTSASAEGFNAKPDEPKVVSNVLSSEIVVDSLRSIVFPGNANLDETISANDAAITLQKALNSSFVTPIDEVLPNYYLNICDVNGDGLLSANDAAYILQKSLDWSCKFPIEE